MPTLRESIRPILIIMLASAFVIFLIAPLDQTQWAAGMRARISESGGGGFEGDGPRGAIRFIGPFLKISILMGVPALVTLGIRGLISRFRTK
ncbi:hypothetical protein Q31b_25050 [Novipirellula aureliae]|uniref:Uncharacterized protein n=1 Tax=Novipirellula aureliae TaxID=2527966 RepID=A0A5C6E4P1_9BACT|nr:hypothetical protein [Novipirellula aureliae]TWU43464.1 hypothetical protein Q31b_25050 [Novipirellula aureliae]